MIELGSPGRKDQEPTPCIFCSIIEGKAEVSQIASSDSSTAFMSLEGYPLVVPKKHIVPETLNDHTPEIVDAYELALSLIPATQIALNASGISIVTNLGKSAGQEVNHIHIHLINRNTGDKKVSFTRPKLLPRMVLHERAEKVRAQLKLLSQRKST